MWSAVFHSKPQNLKYSHSIFDVKLKSMKVKSVRVKILQYACVCKFIYAYV